MTVILTEDSRITIFIPWSLRYPAAMTPSLCFSALVPLQIPKACSAHNSIGDDLQLGLGGSGARAPHEDLRWRFGSAEETRLTRSTFKALAHDPDQGARALILAASRHARTAHYRPDVELRQSPAALSFNPPSSPP